MKLTINEELLDRHNDIYIFFTRIIKEAIKEKFSKDDKEDLSIAYITVMAILRIASNLAIKLGIDHEAFIFGCSQMYTFEEVAVHGKEHVESEIKKELKTAEETQNLKSVESKITKLPPKNNLN